MARPHSTEPPRRKGRPSDYILGIVPPKRQMQNKRPRTAGHCEVYFAFHPIASVGRGGDFLRNPETLGLIDPIDPPYSGNEKRVASGRPVWHVICSRTSQLSLVARGHDAP